MGEQTDIAIVAGTKERPARVGPPKLWDVVFINDDYTPMDFVVDMLMKHFRHNEDTATMIMLDVHQKGRGVAGTYVHDIAETKARMVMHYAQEAGHPLQTVIREHD